MTDTPHKERPLPIRHAMVALEILREEDEALAVQLEKILPSYAMRLSQRGEDVSVEGLLDAARQGVESLKSAFTNTQKKQELRSFLQRYEEIVAAFPTEEPELLPLTAAAARGDMEEMARLLENGTDHHVKNDEALHYAAKNGHTEAVRLLLNRGARIQSGSGAALSYAARNGHTQTIQLLLEHTPDISTVNFMVMSNAAENGHTEIVRLLLDRGTDIHARGDEALRLAAKNGHSKTVHMLLDRGANIHARDDYALQLAAEHGHNETVKLLLDRGADIHAQNDCALRHAARFGHSETVRLLLDRGADIHVENGFALLHAAENGYSETVRLLLDRGANLHVVDHRSALRRAASNGHSETVRLLLDRGANLHVVNHGTALRGAASNGHSETVRLLLDRGANLHVDDDSALRKAAENGCSETVRLLLDRGANLHVDNDIALRWAAENGHSKTVRLLLDRGANASVLTANQMKTAERYRPHALRWEKAIRVGPPQHLEGCDATVFKPALFWDLVSIIKGEGYHRNVMAYPFAYMAMALLQNETRVLQYLKKWGSGKQPLHDLIYMVKMPTHDLSNVNLAAWGDAMLQHGPKMARLASFSHRLPQPLRTQDGKNWSYARTRAEVAKFAYPRAAEHPQLAALCFEHLVDEDAFETALKLVQKKKPQHKNMPDITIEGTRFGMEGAAFKKLANDDIRGLFLGELTDCCQSIGGAGENCATHGFTSKNGGFYVVETAQGEIIGQSWAWRGDKGELCFDSLEALGTRVSAQQWKQLLDETAKELTTRTDHTVTALHVGMSGKTPQSLSQHFTQKAAKPVDYKGYRDSKTQIRVWKR